MPHFSNKYNDDGSDSDSAPVAPKKATPAVVPSPKPAVASPKEVAPEAKKAATESQQPTPVATTIALAPPAVEEAKPQLSPSTSERAATQPPEEPEEGDLVRTDAVVFNTEVQQLRYTCSKQAHALAAHADTIERLTRMLDQQSSSPSFRARSPATRAPATKLHEALPPVPKRTRAPTRTSVKAQQAAAEIAEVGIPKELSINMKSDVGKQRSNNPKKEQTKPKEAPKPKEDEPMPEVKENDVDDDADEPMEEEKSKDSRKRKQPPARSRASTSKASEKKPPSKRGKEKSGDATESDEDGNDEDYQSGSEEEEEDDGTPKKKAKQTTAAAAETPDMD